MDCSYNIIMIDSQLVGNRILASRNAKLHARSGHTSPTRLVTMECSILIRKCTLKLD